MELWVMLALWYLLSCISYAIWGKCSLHSEWDSELFPSFSHNISLRQTAHTELKSSANPLLRYCLCIKPSFCTLQMQRVSRDSLQTASALFSLLFPLLFSACPIPVAFLPPTFHLGKEVTHWKWEALTGWGSSWCTVPICLCSLRLSLLSLLPYTLCLGSRERWLGKGICPSITKYWFIERVEDGGSGSVLSSWCFD